MTSPNTTAPRAPWGGCRKQTLRAVAVVPIHPSWRGCATCLTRIARWAFLLSVLVLAVRCTPAPALLLWSF